MRAGFIRIQVELARVPGRMECDEPGTDQGTTPERQWGGVRASVERIDAAFLPADADYSLARYPIRRGALVGPSAVDGFDRRLRPFHVRG